jgi:predicted phage-related endonuclease
MKPGSPEWTRLVTASKVSAILGLSPWDSPRTMWHVMRGDIDGQKDTDATRRGHYLESGVVDWWLDQHGRPGEWAEQSLNRYEDWGAATPDLVGDDDGHGNEYVLDAKTAATDDDWGTPGTDEAPAYYVAQSMWQLACRPQASVAYIAVLFGRPRLGFAEYVIERDDALIADIVARCRAFYDSLASDVPPPLSDNVAEYDAIRKVHVDIDRDAEVILPDELADRYLTDLAHAARADSTKAHVLDAMGTARIAKRADGLTIARRQPKGDAVTLARVAALPAIDTKEAS